MGPEERVTFTRPCAPAQKNLSAAEKAKIGCQGGGRRTRRSKSRSRSRTRKARKTRRH